MSVLMAYDWPGNVRELKSAFEYAYVVCHDFLIRPYHLPPGIARAQGQVEKPEELVVDAIEIHKRDLIDVLRKSGGNQSEAARMLGASRVTIWNRIEKLKIDLRRSVL